MTAIRRSRHRARSGPEYRRPSDGFRPPRHRHGSAAAARRASGGHGAPASFSAGVHHRLPASGARMCVAPAVRKASSVSASASGTATSIAAPSPRSPRPNACAARNPASPAPRASIRATRASLARNAPTSMSPAGFSPSRGAIDQIAQPPRMIASSSIAGWTERKRKDRRSPAVGVKNRIHPASWAHPIHRTGITNGNRSCSRPALGLPS